MMMTFSNTAIQGVKVTGVEMPFGGSANELGSALKCLSERFENVDLSSVLNAKMALPSADVKENSPPKITASTKIPNNERTI